MGCCPAVVVGRTSRYLQKHTVRLPTGQGLKESVLLREGVVKVDISERLVPSGPHPPAFSLGSFLPQPGSLGPFLGFSSSQYNLTKTCGIPTVLELLGTNRLLLCFPKWLSYGAI